MKQTKKNIPSLVLAALLLFATVSSALPSAQSTNPFVGDWKGSINIASVGVELEIALHFTLNDKKEITGTFDSPSQGGMGLPLGSIKIEAKKIEFALSGVPGDPFFKGALDETGKKLAGAFSQNGLEGTFTTEKIQK